MVVSGEGWSGYVSSSSTHRTGVVTNADVTATALESMGIERPVAVLGDAMVPVSGQAALVTRAARVSRVSDAAIAIDAPKAGVLNFFIGLVVLLFGATALVLSLSRGMKARTRADLRPRAAGTPAAHAVGAARRVAHVPGDAPAEKPSGRGCIARRRGGRGVGARASCLAPPAVSSARGGPRLWASHS